MCDPKTYFFLTCLHFNLKKTLSKSQKDFFLKLVPKPLSSLRKSAALTDPLLSLVDKTIRDERVNSSQRNLSYVIDPGFLTKEDSLDAKVQDF